MATRVSHEISSQACVQGAADLRRAFDLLGRRWNGVILGALTAGPVGFSELARAIDGISDSVLSDRLASLGRGGLITRTVDEGPPLAVAYGLSDAGRALIPILAELVQWAQAHLPTDEKS